MNETEAKQFITNGESFGALAERLTIGGAAYGPAIAAFNNMAGQDISGGKWAIKIPVNWLRAEVTQDKGIFLGGSFPSWIWFAGAGVLIVMLLRK